MTPESSAHAFRLRVIARAQLGHGWQGLAMSRAFHT